LKTGINKHLKLLLKIAVTAAALYFVFSRIEGKKLLETYGNLSLLPLAAACAMFVFSKLIAAFRLNIFLRFSGISISEWANIKLYLLGMFYNVFLPGGISGDGYKSYLLKKKFNLSIGRILSAVFVDRISGVHALFILSVILFYFSDFAKYLRPYIWGLLPLSYAMFYLIIRKFWKSFIGIFTRTSLLSLAVQMTQLACAWFIMLSLDIAGQEARYLLIFLISSIVAILPITVGGVGSREVTFFLGADILGLDVNLSISLSLMFYFITLLVSLSGAVFVFKTPFENK
jgi:uncharacterized membrane protein YbhN (UPF0104 family)